jgi:hypothetical protein
MPTPSVSAAYVKDVLVNRCGYADDLVRSDYPFAQGKSVELAAFAHRPLDARSACIALIDCRSSEPRTEVLKHRELGAPVVFARFNNKLQVWKPSAHGAKRIGHEMAAGDLPRFFSDQHDNLAPRRIYDAKTLGRLPDAASQQDMFVDAGLMPYAESELARILIDAVVRAVGILKGTFPTGQLSDSQETWIVKSTFCFLAAKVLQDKRVPSFISLNLLNTDETFQRIQSHYGSNTTFEIGSASRRQGLQSAAQVFADLGDTSHLTSETWADVYERALITADVRQVHGVHATPPYLVDYIVWQLAPWIENLDPSQLRVFEPACGHAPFLAGVMRLLRNFNLGKNSHELSAFFRQRLAGIEIDEFSVEIARLSLTVADVPNRNGWTGLRCGNMFEGKTLLREARRSSVLLSNPPFEGTKALQMLQRTLPNLPPGAVFGVIVPSTLLFSEKDNPTTFRRWLLENCQLAEISLYPDNIFAFADHECAILLGKKLKTTRPRPIPVRCKRVRESGRNDFKLDYRFTSSRTFPQTRLAAQPDHTLWIPEWDDEIWTWLSDNPKLGSITEVNQGLQHKSKGKLPPGTKTVAGSPFRGGIKGFASIQGDRDWGIHEHPRFEYFNLAPESIRRPGSGAHTGIAQVVLNHNPVSRDMWRLKPFIDHHGRPVASNFITIRPKSPQYPLEYIWALCCSPLANAFVFAHCLKRNIHIGEVRRLPIPDAGEIEISRVVNRALAYIDAAKGGTSELAYEGTVTETELHRLLMLMDAEVLRLYQLPARTERKLLKLFEDEQRPGVPVAFLRYYPKDFKESIPLYVYLSDAYQRRLAGVSADLTEAQEAEYESLTEKRSDGTLTSRDEASLYALQAEVDGRDYAAKLGDEAWLDRLETDQERSRAEIGQIAKRLSDLKQKGKPPDDRKPRP